MYIQMQWHYFHLLKQKTSHFSLIFFLNDANMITARVVIRFESNGGLIFLQAIRKILCNIEQK